VEKPVQPFTSGNTGKNHPAMIKSFDAPRTSTADRSTHFIDTQDH